MDEMSSLENKKKQLQDDIAKYVEERKSAQIKHERTGDLVTIASLIGTVGVTAVSTVTAVGVVNLSVVATVLGALSAVTVGVQHLWADKEKGVFYKGIINEAGILQIELKFKVKSEDDFNDVLKRFEDLKRRAVTDLPKGGGAPRGD